MMCRTIEEKVVLHDEKLRHHDEDIKELKEKVNKIDNYREENTLTVNNIQRDVKDVKEDVKDVKDNMTELKDMIINLEKSLKQNTDEHFKEIENKQKKQNDRLKILENKDNEKRLSRYNFIVNFIKKGLSTLVGKIIFSIPFLYGLYELLKKVFENFNK